MVYDSNGPTRAVVYEAVVEQADDALLDGVSDDLHNLLISFDLV
jgi:hypothetical protein